MRAARLTAVDLFAGCGGLSLGLRNAGFDVKAAVEIDATASKTYKRNHPKTHLVNDDLREVDPADLARKIPKGQLSLLAGCAPCQGFCSLTAKWGREDPRNRLVLQMARFVEALAPDAIFMENVPGLETRGKDLLDELLSLLRKAGYYAEVHVIQMANFGVPQNRRRLVLLAGRGFMIPFPAETHARVPKPDSGLHPWVTMRDAIYGWKAPVKLSQSWRKGGPKKANWHVVRDIQERTLQRLKAAVPGQTWLSIDEALRPDCHKGGYSGFTNVYGRMSWDTVSVTVTSGCTTPCKGRFGHPDRRRTTISVREAASLQTFPKTYKFDTEHMDDVCDMIGNAVPPAFARVIAKQIAETLGEHYEALARKRKE